MCESLCVYYGEYLGTFQGKPHHSFPNAEALAGNSIEQELRDLGFGYRAKFINQTAKRMVDNPDMHDSLVHGKLRTKSRAECQEFLLEFPGVGPKVADCVALMSLDKHDVVPVDTHVYQIAKRDYKFRSTTKNKTMTKNVYDEIQQFFVCLWGDYAGWAHSLLFAADLRDLENGINDTTTLPSKRPLEDENDPVVVKRLEYKNNRDSVV
ncbi:DEKNAAC100851 [Brettanomyces naardenensis]|uniref:DNA-(apurinic or apyrimidinic site) lyase n=1 Tax=Brettanomyces naardenensis TaxID=13370 RepID=A0A448YGN4_BRENA|nr:DEKNAAC100851 [Brettanomyces naardenensis]